MAKRLDIAGILKGWEIASSIQRRRIGIPQQEGMELVCEIGRRMRPDFVIDARNRFVYENLVRWMFADPACLAQSSDGKAVPADLTKGIYIAGPTGTGKTLCMRLFATFAKSLALSYDVCGKKQFIDFNFYRSDLICDEYASEGDLQKFKQMPILCIEDLGSESLETLYMGNRRNVLQSILEARGDRFLQLTCVTSNIPIDRLADNYGDRVQSRASEMFNYYILSGADRRS